MKPVNFPEANKTYTAPPDMPNCLDLHTWHGIGLNGFPAVISKWQLSPEEIKRIVETGSLYLEVTGSAIPPMRVYIDSPFVQIKTFENCETLQDFENLQLQTLNQMEMYVRNYNKTSEGYKELEDIFNMCAEKIRELITNASKPKE